MKQSAAMYRRIIGQDTIHDWQTCTNGTLALVNTYSIGAGTTNGKPPAGYLMWLIYKAGRYILHSGSSQKQIRVSLECYTKLKAVQKNYIVKAILNHSWKLVKGHESSGNLMKVVKAHLSLRIERRNKHICTVY